MLILKGAYYPDSMLYILTLKKPYSGVGKCIKIGGHQLELHARAIAYPCTLLKRT